MIRVGTSGWSYPDWVGPVYPVSARSDTHQWLRHYATRFRAVEINSTFYAFPNDDLVASWGRQGVDLQAEGPFEFSVKLPREVTHDALLKGDVDRAWETTARFERHVLEPLADDGLLGAVLVQLHPAIAPTAAHVDALQQTLSALADRRVALEPRNEMWVEEGRLVPNALPLFTGGNVCLAELDGPSLPPVETPPAKHAYVRFHGRRADVWRRGQESYDHEKYDYLYTVDELRPWAERARSHQDADREVRTFFNNTPGGKAVANGLEMLHLLGKAQDVPRPKLTEQTKLPV